MTDYFPKVGKIAYKQDDSRDLLAFHHYNPDEIILNKTMREHCRFAVCYWHTFCWQGNDSFGSPVFDRAWFNEAAPMKRAMMKADAAFEFFKKLGVDFFTFHDRDIAPEGDTIKESNKNLMEVAEKISKKMSDNNIQLLFGTANLFSHPRYLAGAATNPDPEVFAHACAQVKTALDVTHQLNGCNYVLWGGREGYETLLNTDLVKESEQLARFLQLVVDYKHKIGFKGDLLIEPKPCEPTKHQYDFDTATVFAFLQKFNLEKEFKVNIEGNHATLAGHSFEHEIAYAFANNLFGSIDANSGDPQLGWDTDQFPIDVSTATRILYVILQNGGFVNGGFNFDTKIRRQSIDNKDLFYGHINAMDTLARGLKNAARIIQDNRIAENLANRYQDWQSDMAQDFLSRMDLTSIAQLAEENNINPEPHSGKQEYLEALFNLLSQ